MIQVQASVIRMGDLGRREAVTPRPRAEEGSVRAAAEQSSWQDRYGRDWVDGIQELARWAGDAGIPIRAGSRALAASDLALGWGWGGLPEGIGSSQSAGWAGTTSSWGAAPSRPTWILRTAPGWGECVRRRVERDSRLEARGSSPCLVVEETPLAYLPGQPHAAAWPGREAWARATRLLGTGGALPLAPAALTPEDWESLLADLQHGAVGRHPLEAERAWLTGWDLWCAASAWERDRAAWWMTRFAVGFAGSEEERQWMQRASDWGLRVLPASVEASRVCPRREGQGVRLGLSALSPRVREIAPELVLDRVRGGAFETTAEFVRRGTRRGAGWVVIVELALAGALSDLRDSLGRTVLRMAQSRWASARTASVAAAGSRAAFSG